jgi:hypothetical protein
MAVRSTARVAAASLSLSIGCAVVAVPFGCSRTDSDTSAEAPPLEEDPQSTAFVRHHREPDGAVTAAPQAEPLPASGSDALDAGAGTGMDASDGRAERELAVLADAGRRCGSRFLPDCPLQGWMREHANSMFMFGDISAIGEVFDEIAVFVPPDTLSDGGPYYQYWVSIAKDGARTVRSGNLNATKAACRECHSLYRAHYHDIERARALPDAAPPPPPVR